MEGYSCSPAHKIPTGLSKTSEPESGPMPLWETSQSFGIEGLKQPALGIGGWESDQPIWDSLSLFISDGVGKLNILARIDLRMNDARKLIHGTTSICSLIEWQLCLKA